MLKVVKKYFNILPLRFFVLVITLVLAFGYSGGSDFIVNAFNGKINIYPGNFSIEQNNDDFSWKSVENTFYQDLSYLSNFSDFNPSNSAYFYVGIGDKFSTASSVPSIEEGFVGDVATSGPDSEFLLDSEDNMDDDEVGDGGVGDSEGIDFGVEEESLNKEKEDVDLGGSRSNQTEPDYVDSDLDDFVDDVEENVPFLDLGEDGIEEKDDELDEISFVDILGDSVKGIKSLFHGLVNLNPVEAQIDESEEEVVEEIQEKENLSASIIYSNFSLPLDIKNKEIKTAYLRASLATESSFLFDKLIFEYNISGDWSRLGEVILNDEVSNEVNEDYFKFKINQNIDWNDIDDMKVRVRYYNDETDGYNLDEIGKSTLVYIDSIWLELNDDLENGGQVLGVEEEADDSHGSLDFDLENFEDSFDIKERPRFSFKYSRKKNIVGKIISGILDNFRDEYKNIEIKASVRPKKQRSFEIESDISSIINYLENGEFEVEFEKNPRYFKPGEYTAEIEVNDNGYIYNVTQDFVWGVLAFNSNKSIYKTSETAFLQMGVLDNEGHTLCDADLFLEVTAPDGGVALLSTENGLIKRNPECAGDTVIDSPDYFCDYQLGGDGVYNVKLTAETVNGTREVWDYFKVDNSVLFDIERIGPTRIFPMANYEMTVKIKLNDSFRGDLKERIPKVFKIIDSELLVGGENLVGYETDVFDDFTNEIVWKNLTLKTGEEVEVRYVFDSPDISPEFYLLGPFKVADSRTDNFFEEFRAWQIAADSVSVYEADGGSYSGFSNPGYAWDLIDGTHATFSYAKKGTDGPNNWLQGTLPTISEIGTITKVEIGLEGYSELSNVNAVLVPYFGGSVQGSDYIVSKTTMGSNDSNQTFYMDITSDTARSGYPSTWTWSEVQNLEVRVWGDNDSNSSARTLYVDQIRVRVTFDPPNDPPTGSFNSAAQKTDGSGVIDVSIEVDDPDDNDTSVRIDYVSGLSCDFSTPLDPTLSEVDGDTTADFGDPKVENDNVYQIGNVSGWIETASGSNTVLFDWASKNDVPTADGAYCLRLTVNDSVEDQSISATSTLIIDNTNPSVPGNLSVFATSGTSVILTFGSQSTDTNFDRYRIYYKEADSGMVTEYDDLHTDSNLNYIDYNGATSTEVTNLFPSTQYVFNIWAYDDYGNKATATTQVFATTSNQLVPPVSSFNSVAQKTDGSGVVDISIEVDDGNGDDVSVKVEYVAGATCSFVSPLDPTLSEVDGDTTADFGDPEVENDNVYQVGNASGWIKTASGSNTVLFDWQSETNIPTANGVYCLRITSKDSDSGDQLSPATTTLVIDNVDPTAPGNLTVSTTTYSSVVLNLGSASTETNFAYYKIFYKAGTSGVLESDTEHIDSNLNYINYNGANTTVVENLSPETQYVFNIWAYDLYGHKTSATELVVVTAESQPIRAKTVMFPAGVYSGNGSTGKNANADNTFNAFNYRLVENDVVIENAYIIFEIQFEAYADNFGDHTGYNLAFDTCQENCTASAFLGSGNVIKDDNTVLSYDETESNQARLLMDVTDEVQLNSYNGGGVNLEGQVGYRIERSSSVNSISYASAILVLTYSYNENTSPNITNTVIYPLESTASGDSGTRRTSQTDSCVLDSNCPLFDYEFDVPEISSSLSNWFKAFLVSDDNNPNRTDDVRVSFNIEGVNINSENIVHENANAGGQGNHPNMYFRSVNGFSENTPQTVEYYATGLGNATFYMMGGEVADTYTASSSASVKTRTVSFPVGIINNGNTTNQTNSSIDVYFPENGLATGTVSIKKAWIRITSSNYTSGANTVTVSTRVGDNLQSGNYIYSYDPIGVVVRPTFNLIHVIPSSDYSELESANSEDAKTVTIYTTNSLVSAGGLSAELMITYTYADESIGYLSSLSLFGGQTDVNGNSQSSTTKVADLVFPELVGNKTVRGGGFYSSYLFSDSDGAMPGSNILIDTNISTGIPSCTNSYITSSDSANAYGEMIKNVRSALSPVNGLSYFACYSNNGGGSATAGAKMNGILNYTYQYEYPPALLTQNDWRWYVNTDSVTPGTAKAAENTAINTVYLHDVIRLRMNVGVSEENFNSGQSSFKLQYGGGSDCSAVTVWQDVDMIGVGGAWEGYDNPSVSDGATLPSFVLSSSTVAETYEEENPSTVNPNQISIGSYGEWDWVLYNNNATSSLDYCFRMVKSDGTYLDFYNNDAYPKLTTAPANTVPTNPSSLKQYKNDEFVIIENGDWINEDSVRLKARATDVDVDETLSIYFELIPNDGVFTTAVSEPVGACSYGTAYDSCAGKIWVATSSLGYYRYSSFVATTSISGIPDSSDGYKWQAIACDDDSVCSLWIKPGPNPNFKVDTVSPTPPGALTKLNAYPTSIEIAFGAETTETNFSEYKIFYKAGTAGVTEDDGEFDDSDLDYINYNNTSSTTVINLSAGTDYVFNIWAYDLAGNKSSSTIELVASTTSSFTPPTGTIYSVAQKTDGSGGVDIAVRLDDPDNDNTLRIKVEYVLGASCDFSSPLVPTLDELDINTSATYGDDPVTDNGQEYQVGSSTGWIWTSSGENFIFFDWLSKEDVPDVSNTYCIRTTINDGVFDQAVSDTQLVIVDNTSPAPPGNLTLNKKTNNSVTLDYGGTSADASFDKYRIFYSTSPSVTEYDFEHLDSDLNYVNYNNTATTTVYGLLSDTIYYFNIWAYDTYGNRASATPLMVKTNALPYNLVAVNQFDSAETNVIANGSWTTENEVRLVAKASDADVVEDLTIYFQFILDSNSFITSTSTPTGACVWGTAYNSCASKVWFVSSSTPGDYSVSPFVATTSITGIPESVNSTSGYKWQVLACDDENCANDWVEFNETIPNLKVDAISPTSPGALTESSKSSGSVSLNFGSVTSELNFLEYKIYYGTSTPLTESDLEHEDANLSFIDYDSSDMTTISGLYPDTQYYFVIYAYDLAGNAASSSEVSVTTNAVVSTPGVLFYTKNSRILYYMVWNGVNWGAEQTGPTLGSAAGDNIRHIRALRSDNGGRIAVFVKTWDGTNQEWWATVYRPAANDFINSSQLGSSVASADNAQLITGCMASLSSGEFFIVKNNGTSAGTLAYSWNPIDGWVTENAGPDPGEVVNGCSLERRPGTDNYLLVTFDDYNGAGANDGNVGTSYYFGGSTYVDSWTTWTEHSTKEEDLDNYIGEAFFDLADNTKGGINYSDSVSTADTKVKYFVCDNTSISYGVVGTSPATWSGDFVNGEFAVDPEGDGAAYYVGRDINDEVNVFKVDISSGSPVWTALTNGDNISSTNLYDEINDSQKPYGMSFYRGGRALAVWNENTSASPEYRIVNASTDTVDSTDTAVPGADANIWTRVRLFEDPNEDELLATYQNDDVDYSVVFFDGQSEKFYNTTDNPGSGQVWTELVTVSGANDADDENTSFAFAKRNSAPSTPTNLIQYKSDATTTIANLGWTNENEVYIKASANDPDTSEVIALYTQLIAYDQAFETSTDEPTGACVWGTAYNDCVSKIWFVATSSAGDYSVTPFTDSVSITGIPDSPNTNAGYKWQVIACDDESRCSNWVKFNTGIPNFKVDTVDPSSPGALTVSSKTSTSVTLNFGVQSSELNFSSYKIFYSSSTPVSVLDVEHVDADLLSINYNGTSNTVVYNLSPDTQYYFNIWAYDLAGNVASSTIVSTTTSLSAYLKQTSFLLENDDGTDVNLNTSEVAADVSLSNLHKGERFSTRFQIENTGGDSALNKVYKIQFENQTDNPGAWTDVGADTEISYSLGLSGDNTFIITSSKAAANGGSWINGSWHEGVNQTGSFSLSNGKYTEFVFAVNTSNAILGKTYRLRLYNFTDNTTLNNYGSYPNFSIIGSEVKRYSKDLVDSLATDSTDLTYYFDPEGYTDIFADDANRDKISASNKYPVFNFVTKNSNNTDAISVVWNGQSTESTVSSNVILQVYRFGSTNNWVTLDSESGVGANTDFSLTADLNSSLSEFYSSNWTFWRVYQMATTTEELQSDYFNATFSAPVSEVKQLHYRWRNDNGDEISASWRENEDDGSPASSTALDIGDNIRLRFETVNIGGGSASNYSYRIEYAPTLVNCATDPGGWVSLPISATTEHFEIATSSYFSDGANTTAQLANTEFYSFVNGDMVEEPSNASGAITLDESEYTEVEYVIKATTNATEAGTYCFRVTDNGSAIDTYDIYPEITLSGITNTAPYFTASTSDNGSASTSPTNYGSNVNFSASAVDPEDDDYRLAVCKTNSITPGNNKAPTCGGGSWCISDLASSSEVASCNYEAATSSEILEWYSFVCDQHAGAGVSKCSVVTQGSGSLANDSPFAVNHAPIFTIAATSDDNKDPGGTFTISTVSSDSDTSNTDDKLYMYVCKTDSANFAGCVGGPTDTVCSQVGVVSSDAECSFTDTAPTPAGDYTYYVYIFDNHFLGATTNSISNTYTINNTVPNIGSLVLNGGSDISLNMKDAPDTTVNTSNISVTDQNGCQTLVSATAVIYMSNVSGGSSCADDDNDCYQIPVSGCILSGCDGESDTTAIYNCSDDFKYFAVPTDNSSGNPNEPYNWLSSMTIYDGGNYISTTSVGVELITTQAIDVVETLIDFGEDLFVGDNSGTNNASTTLVNAGNSPINSNISGTDMVGIPSGVLDSTQIEWSLNHNFSYNSGTDLLNGGEVVDIYAPKATGTNDVIEEVFWGIGIPYGADSSTYYGQNTFQAVIDVDEW